MRVPGPGSPAQLRLSRRRDEAVALKGSVPTDYGSHARGVGEGDLSGAGDGGRQDRAAAWPQLLALPGLLASFGGGWLRAPADTWVPRLSATAALSS